MARGRIGGLGERRAGAAGREPRATNKKGRRVGRKGCIVGGENAVRYWEKTSMEREPVGVALVEETAIRAAAPQLPLWDAIYQRIKSDIITLVLAPGQPLRESQLAAQQGVSRTPVREALRRLAYEGLVRIIANSGAIVSEVSLRDFLEIIRVRELLEPFVAGAAIETINAVTLAELAQEFRRLQGTARGEEAYHALNEADGALHLALLDAAGNRQIQLIMENLNAMIHRFRYLSAARVFDDSIAEHLAIIEALQAGDRKGAENAMRRHIIHLRENSLKML